jgi:15-cis-phytoene synthase
MSPYSEARDICRRHARSFYFASHFLPRQKRNHAYAVYAFCRLLDDAVDEAEGDIDQKLKAIAGFQSLLDDIYARPEAVGIEQPALVAFAQTASTCRIPKAYFEELAEGCRMDLSIARYATWGDLEQYCYRVAGVVGLVMCRVFDLQDPTAEAQAVQMGNAMQLTNILRDVGEDLDRGRIYLPLEDLARFGVDEQALARRTIDERFIALMRFQIERARGLFSQGARGLSALPADGSRSTASVMAVVYGGILSAIEAQGYDVFRRRAHLTNWQKLARIPGALRLARRGIDALPQSPW